jgi:hypothetical protein
MISLEECDKILKSYNYNTSSEELKEIRTFLYQMAELQIENEKYYE